MKRFPFFSSLFAKSGTNSFAGSEDIQFRYLLGEMDPTERDAFEDRYFGDDALHEQLLVAEDDLVDAYARGELTQEQSTHFREFFLRSEERLGKLQLAQALTMRGKAATAIGRHRPWILRPVLPTVVVAPFAIALVASSLFFYSRRTFRVETKVGRSNPADSPAEVASNPLKIRDGMPIVVRLDQDIPRNVKPGTPIRFRVESAVQLEGYIVIAADAPVLGEVVGNVPNAPLLRFINVQGQDGRVFKLRALSSKGAAVRPLIVTAREKTGPKALAAEKGTEYIAFLDGDQDLLVRTLRP